MRFLVRLGLFAGLLLGAGAFADALPRPWPSKPLTLNECLDVALEQNASLRKAQRDIAEAAGIAIQAQSAALPRLNASGNYGVIDEGKIESAPLGPGPTGFRFQRDQNWQANIQLAQPLFAGGRIQSSLRSARLTRDAALSKYHAELSQVILQVRTAFDDVLLSKEQIIVQESSIRLLEQELADTRRRFDAGVAPRFNVLRAEVELANAKPRLIRARNSLKNARNNLAHLLGWPIPKDAPDDIPLEVNGHLAFEPYSVALAEAIAKGLQQRPELASLRTAEKLRTEDLKQARAAWLPQLSGVAGYGWQNRTFSASLSDDIHGWTTGAQLSWDIWDAGLTRGKVKAAQARRDKARVETDETGRRVELEVRTAYSNFQEAREVIESQSKVIEQAEEAVRLAKARADAGTGTQLDVLSAQTALTEARTVYAVALRDYDVARARLDRAMGERIRMP